MKAKILPAICFSVILGVLFLPMVQENIGIFKEKPLAGVENITDSVPLKDTTWLSGRFQENYAMRMYKWMGLRPSMVRLRNQIDYTFFNEPYRSVMIGKENELFGRGSVETILGEDFAGWEAVKYHAEHTMMLQNWFAQRQIAMVTVLTPSKLQVMPEYLPSENLQSPVNSNYAAYLKTLKEYNIFLMDFAPVLKEWMTTKPHRIFPRTGTHWTDFAATLASDSIIGYLENLLGKPFVRPEITSVETSIEMRDTDADAGDLLNLICDLEPAPIGYPTLRFVTEGRLRPRVLVIGDSFWWKVYNQGIHKNCFASGSQYRYYNYEVFSDQWAGAKIIDQFDLLQTISNVDAVILTVNADNLHRYPFSFVDQALTVKSDK